MEVLYGLLRHFTYNVELVGVVFSGSAHIFLRAKSVNGRRLLRNMTEVLYMGGGTNISGAFTKISKYSPDVIVIWPDGEFWANEIPLIHSVQEILWYLTNGDNKVAKRNKEHYKNMTPWALTHVIDVKNFVT